MILKILSLFLALSMLAVLFTAVPAFAADTADKLVLKLEKTANINEVKVTLTNTFSAA